MDGKGSLKVDEEEIIPANAGGSKSITATISARDQSKIALMDDQETQRSGTIDRAKESLRLYAECPDDETIQ